MKGILECAAKDDRAQMLAAGFVRRQPVDERLRPDRAADGGRTGGRHDAGRGVRVSRR
jgi:hypothetical protein